MTTTTSGNAMTEVALALAMAFFSLMVLTMVSMGTPQPSPQSKAPSGATAPEMTLAISAESKQAAKKGPTETTLVVYWQGSFLDQNLRPLNPKTQSFKGRVILALPPALPMGQALEARAQINAKNLVVSALDNTWLDRLSKPFVKE